MAAAYKEFINGLRKVCTKRGFSIRKIGSAGRRSEYPMFKAVINGSGNVARTVCFSAGIHGEEPAGPFAALEFVKSCDPSRFRNVKVVLFPVANPYGFDRGIRRNAYNEDLNGHFCHRILSGENAVLHDAIKNEKVFFFHALHEDEGMRRFYLYDFERSEQKVYRDVVRTASRYFPIDTRRKIYDDLARGGRITNRYDGSFEDRMFRDGAPYSMCTETPEAQPFEKRIRCNIAMMDLVLGFSERS